MILLDTNLLIRLANPKDVAYPAAVAAVNVLKAAGEQLRTVPQNLYEFWVAATRPAANNGLGFTTVACDAELTNLEALFPLLPDQPGLLAEWKTLVVAHDCKGKIAHDARLVAAMRTHGVTRLLTFNGADFARFPGITVLDPVAVIPPGTAPLGGGS